ncbi:hypothetical protein BU17DRAFT_64640 [Hysterangium stoloniferum]|nr:hypothetical protein BU17DRAFT_64640 [Hysterangium stoloniferum]
MSLSKDALNKKAAMSETAPPNDLPITFNNKDAASIRSSSGATLRSVRSVAESVASFYSLLTGGNRVPKRRRAEVSRLGAPKWYHGDAPFPSDMPGTEPEDQDGPFTTAHAVSDSTGPDRPATSSIILYNHSPPNAHRAKYFNQSKIQGEIWLRFDKPTTVAAVDVWLYGKAESVIKLVGKPLADFHANLYRSTQHGLLGGLIHHTTTTLSSPGIPEDGHFPPGTYIFPFEFPSLPRFVKVKPPFEDMDMDAVAWVPLPPTTIVRRPEGVYRGFEGAISYGVGLNIEYGMGLTPAAELDIPFSYFPRVRPTPREDVPFPFIPGREDWPFRREVIGGWTITPFGGRGRFQGEIIDLEGLLGVQTPEVYCPGQKIKYGLLLWSSSTAALEALSDPDSFDVVFSQSEIYGTDSLKPRNSARHNRRLIRLSQGRIWKTDDGPPVDETMPQLRPAPLIYKAPGPTMKTASGHGKKSPLVSPTTATTLARQSAPSALQNSVTADKITEPYSLLPKADDSISLSETLVNRELTITTEEEINKEARSSSPTPSLKELDEADIVEKVVRLDGDVMVMRGIGIQAETPIWIVTLPPRGKDDPETVKAKDEVETTDLSLLPITGTALDVGPNPIRAAKVLGAVTTKERPSWRLQRPIAF